MAHSEPLTILLAHNRWANRNIFEACAKLDDAALDRAFEIGPGSLRFTLTHILGSTRGWTDVLNEGEHRPRLEETRHEMFELVDLCDPITDEFETAANAKPLDGIVRPERGGKIYPFTRGQILTHVTTHAMHHRAQCMNMLRHSGVTPLPPDSVLQWMVMVDPAE